MIIDHHNDLTEVGAILAAGLQRLLERKSTQKSRCKVENPLDCYTAIDGDVRQTARN